MPLLQLDASIPPVGEKRLAVRLTPDAVRHVRGGHPWVYDQSIRQISHDGSAGDLAVIFDKDRSFLAIGLFDPDSPIRIKILHAGKPTQIDDSFWRSRVNAAAKVRAGFGAEVGKAESQLDAETTGYRCINGENDQMPGLILDRYGSTFVLKLYSAAWLPHLESVVRALVEEHGPASIVLRLSRSVAAGKTFGLSDGQTIYGPTVVGPTIFIENGIAFEADVVRGQKTGHFLDQRDNRAEVGRHAKGADVLDVFSCTGGFALHAAVGGASSVTCIDQSSHALEGVRRNFELNDNIASVAKCQVIAECGDAYQVLDQMARDERSFDIVVIDPPSFAQRQSSVPLAIRSYERLTEAGIQLLGPDGLLFQASCSSRVTTEEFDQLVVRAARRSGRPFEEVGRFGHAIDHPVSFNHGSYLKAIMLRFDG